MKTIGKIAVLAMTLSLAGVLSACGGTAAPSSTAASSAASASAEAANAASASAEAASAEAASAESTEAASTESTAKAASDEAASAAAAAKAAETEAVEADAPTTYSNQLFDIAFTLPEGWAFASAEDLESANAAAGAGDGNEIDCIAASVDGQQTVTIALEKFSDQNSSQTAADHVEAMTAGVMETPNATVEADDATISLPSGVEIPAKEITVKSGDQESCTMFGALKSDDYGFMDIKISGPSADEVNAVVSGFGNA